MCLICFGNSAAQQRSLSTAQGVAVVWWWQVLRTGKGPGARDKTINRVTPQSQTDFEHA